MFATGTPTVTVKLDKDRTLGFTLGAMERVQSKLGKAAFSGESETEELTALPVYVWACLSKADREELALEDVKELLHPGNMQAVSEAIGDLFIRSNPEGAEGNVVTAGAGKGKR